MYTPMKFLYTAFTNLIKNSLSKTTTRHCLALGCFKPMYSKTKNINTEFHKTFCKLKQIGDE